MMCHEKTNLRSLTANTNSNSQGNKCSVLQKRTRKDGQVRAMPKE